MRSHFGLDVDAVDEVEGFNLTKGKRQTLYLAVVTEAASRRSTTDPTSRRLAGAAREQPLVK